MSIPEGTPAGQDPTPFVGEPPFVPPSFNPLNGSLVGVGKPIYINFARPIANRALAVDVTLGQGHIVMFALRPFWRWQTQGTYFLAFNAILNWNHLDAGKAPPPQRSATDAGQ